jgi:hypothetical protein
VTRISGRIHTCSVCGLQDVWGETWQWYGSYNDIDDGNPITKVCSEACRREAPFGKVGYDIRWRDKGKSSGWDVDEKPVENVATIKRKDES